jgi:hypothetical protein
MDKKDCESSIIQLCLGLNEKDRSEDYDISFIEFMELCGLFFENDL